MHLTRWCLTRIACNCVMRASVESVKDSPIVWQSAQVQLFKAEALSRVSHKWVIRRHFSHSAAASIPVIRTLGSQCTHLLSSVQCQWAQISKPYRQKSSKPCSLTRQCRWSSKTRPLKSDVDAVSPTWWRLSMTWMCRKSPVDVSCHEANVKKLLCLACSPRSGVTHCPS